MTKANNYRQIICQFLQDFAEGDPEAQLIFDEKRALRSRSLRDRYLVIHVGWRNHQ